MKRKNKKPWKRIGNALHSVHIHNQNYLVLTQILEEIQKMNKRSAFGLLHKE